MTDISKRKLDHVRIAKSPASDMKSSSFSRIKLNYRSLPEVDLGDVDSSCDFLGRRLSFPFMVSGMTGGADDLGLVNRIIAEGCREAGVAFSLGSVRAMIEDRDLVSSYDVRDVLGDMPLIINLGLVQLNYGVNVSDIEWCIETLKADMVCFHLNPLQEALQIDGDTNFSDLKSRLAEVVAQLKVPVMVKDVGFGISPKVYSELLECGVECIDVSGSGGTSWAYIEGERGDSNLATDFLGVGLDTVSLLSECEGGFKIAGGGIRSGVDIFKSVCLGASLGTSARPILLAAEDGVLGVVDLLTRWRRQFQICQFVTGVSSYAEVLGNRDLIIGCDGI